MDAYGEPLAIGTQLEIDADTRPVLCEIFTRYSDGWSPRAIADDLNRRRVPSPGSAWRNRRVRRAAGWLGSAVRGILANELYRGRYVWNQTTWAKDPDTGARRVVQRPKSEWVVSTMPELQIIDEDLWQRVCLRKAQMMRASGSSAGRTAGFS